MSAAGTRTAGVGAGAGVRFGEGRFALFAECVLAGFWLVLGALPLVTLLPSYAAACTHLRRYLDGEPAGRREFAAALRDATRAGWRFSLLWWGALALLGLDWRIAASGLLPGGPALAAVSVLGGLVVVVAGLRAASAWRPGEPSAPRKGPGRRSDWGSTGFSDALRRACSEDRGGSWLLAGGLAVVAVAGWMLPPLLIPALGCLAACAVAVDRRTGSTGAPHMPVANEPTASRTDGTG
ncbi:DUF624 domain-containing protein [Streptomyces sp. NPDC054796]